MKKLFHSIGEEIEGSIKSKLFGKSCFKVNKKAYVCFFQHSMVFKLTGETFNEALSLDGALLFDPSGKGRPMKEWVQVPFEYKGKWKELALKSFEYVESTIQNN